MWIAFTLAGRWLLLIDFEPQQGIVGCSKSIGAGSRVIGLRQQAGAELDIGG
jgi:hypothetical protein